MGVTQSTWASTSALIEPRGGCALRPSFWRTWRPSTAQRATRRPPRGSPLSGFPKTSTTLPPSLSPSSPTPSQRRRSLLRGSSGISTGTTWACKQKQTNMDVKKGGELNVRELDFYSRYIYLCALLFKVLHPFLRRLWNDFKCKYILTSEKKKKRKKKKKKKKKKSTLR